MGDAEKGCVAMPGGPLWVINATNMIVCTGCPKETVLCHFTSATVQL